MNKEIWFPDKIYVHVRTEPRPSITFSEAVEKNSTNEEYIHKDALLEWVKSQKSRLKQGYKHEWKNDDILLGGNLILDNLIDKIELL